MGRITGSYGILGWVRVLPYSDERDALAGYPEWWVGGEPVRLEEARLQGAVLVARLAGVDTREQALKLKGAAVAVPRRAFAPAAEGQYYYADLVGFDVVNAQGEELGSVASLFSNGAQDVLELGGERKRLLPWIPQVVKNVDLAARRIEVDWGADW
ncbi:MAG: ribosome maturation factor RimM [Burkholderiales bacterium]